MFTNPINFALWLASCRKELVLLFHSPLCIVGIWIPYHVSIAWWYRISSKSNCDLEIIEMDYFTRIQVTIKKWSQLNTNQCNFFIASFWWLQICKNLIYLLSYRRLFIGMLSLSNQSNLVIEVGANWLKKVSNKII